MSPEFFLSLSGGLRLHRKKITHKKYLLFCVLELLLLEPFKRLRIRVGAEGQFATPDRFKRTSDSTCRA
jgi:hypothetical protein